MDVDEVYALCLFLSLLFLFRQRLVDSSPLSLLSPSSRLLHLPVYFILFLFPSAGGVHNVHSNI